MLIKRHDDYNDDDQNRDDIIILRPLQRLMTITATKHDGDTFFYK